MRTAVKYVPALAVIGIVACSSPRNSDGDLARAQNLRSELANSSSQSTQAVVSDVEVPPVATLTPTRAGNTADPRGRALGKPAKSGTSAIASVNRDSNTSTTPVQKPAETSAIDSTVGQTQVAAPVLEVVTPTTTVISVEPTPISVPAPRPHPMEPVSAGEGGGPRGTSGGGPMDERPPVITPRPGPDIIRGGPSRDPCAIHAPGMPRGGSILINNRIPVNPRGGVRFPGGIR